MSAPRFTRTTSEAQGTPDAILTNAVRVAVAAHLKPCPACGQAFGLNQVARDIGIDKSLLSGFVSGNKSIGTHTLDQIAAWLGADAVIEALRKPPA